MFWSRQRLKEMAKVALHGSYWKSVFASLIVTLVLGVSLGSRSIIHYRFEAGSSPQAVLANGMKLPAIFLLVAFIFAAAGVAVFIALSILVFWPAEVGCRAYFDEALYAPADLRVIGKGFGPEYMNVMKIQLKRYIYTFLWSLLLIVPGIMKFYEYSMIPYLLAENPGMDEKECFRTSKAMMNGEKWEAFLLDLSFIGWMLLGTVTAGLVWYFYAGPYYELTWAGLFGALKVKMSNGGAEQAAGFGGQADLSRMGPSEETAPAGAETPAEYEIPPVAEFTAIHDPDPFPQPLNSEETAGTAENAFSADFEDVPEAEYTTIPEAETKYAGEPAEEADAAAETDYAGEPVEEVHDAPAETEYADKPAEEAPDAAAETKYVGEPAEEAPDAAAETEYPGESPEEAEVPAAEFAEESVKTEKGYEPAPWEVYAASNPAPWETEVPLTDAADGLKEDADTAETSGQNRDNPFEI